MLPNLFQYSSIYLLPCVQRINQQDRQMALEGKQICIEVTRLHVATVASKREELKAIDAEKVLMDTGSGAVGQTYSFLQMKGGCKF